MTLAEEVWDGLGFCGCGNPEDVMALFRDALAAMRLRFQSRWDAQPDIIASNDPRTLLLLYVLAQADLTEHGGSVYGSWLSDKGAKLLDYLEQTPADQWFPGEEGQSA